MAPRTPLFRPKAYFESRGSTLTPALGVFALYVVGSIVLTYALADLLLAQVDDAPAEFEAALNSVMGTMVVFLVIIAIVALLLVAAIMHYLSGDGESGSFGDAVAVAGWAYAPNLLALPVKYADARRYFEGLSFDGSDPAVLATQLETVDESTTAVSTVLTLLVVAWSVFILAKGAAGTHDTVVDDTIGPALLIGVGVLVMEFLF